MAGKEDNRGFSLVELIIAMAVSAIIMIAVIAFMRSAQSGFNSASNTISLQTESQILMEQISGWIMEGNGAKTDGDKLIIYYIPYKADGTTLDSIMGLTAEQKAERTQEASKRVIWMADGKLYTYTFDGIADPDADTTDDSVLSTYTNDRYCICEYVEDFVPTVNQSTAKEPKVEITLKLKTGARKYELTNEFTLRNEWRLAWEGGKHYEEEVA